MSDPRFLELIGADNVRDLGDLATADGRRVARGLILRADFLVSLREEDERLLVRELGLRRVIDLRTVAEVAAHPGPWEAVGLDVVRASLPLDPAFVANRGEDMVGLYLSFLDPPAPAMTAALQALLDIDKHPVLVHCAAGKDRTGVLVALALELLGVQRNVIGADFALTHARMPRVRKRLEDEAGRRQRPGLPDVMYGARAATIEAFLAHVQQRFGGAAGWARSQGIPDGQIERFRAACVVGVGSQNDASSSRSRSRTT